MKKRLEVLTFEYKGIKVDVKIDYIAKTVSLVDLNSHSVYKCETINKNWVFVGRTLDYMNGWLNILDAMKYAVTEAKKLLEHDLAEETKFQFETMDKIEKLLTEKKKK